ncbi:hypothetical protein Fmac_031873 [Flemingia macrophylla]|uniref:ATPase AAA-type core domain-containing protein n=1 Tax=Flemingia macrophylla TaxID=520843 RepID=A0ABD1L3B6_9FABA
MGNRRRLKIAAGVTAVVCNRRKDERHGDVSVPRFSLSCRTPSSVVHASPVKLIRLSWVGDVEVEEVVVVGVRVRNFLSLEEGLFDMIRASKPAKASLQEDKKPVNKVITSIPVKIHLSSRSPSKQAKPKIATTVHSSLIWTMKHQPKDPKDIIGNQSLVTQLRNWLKTWNEQFLDTVNKKQGKKQNDSGAKRAVLLCGTPGIGKTTSAKLVCQELGFQAIEVAVFLVKFIYVEKIALEELAKDCECDDIYKVYKLCICEFVALSSVIQWSFTWLLSGFNAGKLKMDERINLSMSDPDLVPLLVQENYINYRPSSAGKDDSGIKRMNMIARAAESIVDAI